MKTSLEDSLAIAQSIDICAPRAGVWRVLTNFADHKIWNTAFQIEPVPASLQIGVQIRVCAAPKTFQERVFTAEIVEVKAPAMLSWRGGEPDIFEGVHRFDLQALDSQQTRLINSETFSGSMAADVLDMSRAVLEAEFLSFNQALKQRVESING
ncbi:SRPBCC domain-containing protein [Oscillatoria sp. CS-180]|uniref:SRPBCC domain-containing protein n=1 Tax=Oscillatoria sp. CS-180 TaxID=3021720 RepID=UPI00232CC972|nr:SRPBCC domain-containing protein [Oscillatoria sp. CS-180]MDB9527790.1 SRPBCC domain-containing protein [Oscillatoria sp. CS-180]